MELEKEWKDGENTINVLNESNSENTYQATKRMI